MKAETVQIGVRNLRIVIIVALCLTGIGLVIAGSGRGQQAPSSFFAGARAHVTHPAGMFAKNTSETLNEMELATILPVATRTGFMARWASVPGASGYRLDVSTSSAFADFVEGYRDLDVGNVTGRVVTGLRKGATYYYRVRAYNVFGTGRESDVMRVATTATTGLIINATFDSTILNDPSAVAIESMINQAINIEESLFTDPITINIVFRWTTSADPCGPIGGGFLGRSCTSIYSVQWNAFVSALMADAKTSNDTTANASLPPGALSTNIIVSSANGRAVGFNTPGGLSYNGGTYDATITLNSGASFQFTRPTTANNYDALRTTEHEIDEVMGLGSDINRDTNYRPQDLFSWGSSGVRNFSSSGTRYFSINSGTTDIVDFNQDPSGDFGDWFSGSCPQAQPYVQNALVVRDNIRMSQPLRQKASIWM